MCVYATLAFELGLGDGPQRRSPRSSDGAMLALMVEGDRWPNVFQRVCDRSISPGFASLARFERSLASVITVGASARTVARRAAA